MYKKAMRDRSLSYTAMGILVYFLARVDASELSLNYLLRLRGNHEDTDQEIKDALNSLVSGGYLLRIGAPEQPRYTLKAEEQ